MRMLKNTEIAEKFGWKSPTTCYNAISDGLLPRFVKTGMRGVGLPDFEVEAILVARLAGQSNEQVKELVKRLHAKRAELATV